MLKTEEKHSGNKDWTKASGDPLLVRFLAKLLSLPVKEQDGYNPTHIDIPRKMKEADDER